jgi:5'-methylthioadenosine phosphorylase
VAGKQTRLAIIGGSQAYVLLQSKAFSGKRLGPVSTPYGPSQPIYEMPIARTPVLLLSRHGEKGYEITASFVNYRANIYALKEHGASHIVAWTGPGAINAAFAPGSFAVVTDMIDETRRRPSTFFEHTGIGFIRMGDVFCPSLRRILTSVLRKLRYEFRDSATYVCTEGPRLETPAEVRMYAKLGVDLVGMTLAPEAFLARELELCYAGLAYVTNFAEGVRQRRYRSGELFEGLSTQAERERVRQAVQRLPTIMRAVAQSFDRATHSDARAHASLLEGCQCQRAMERYRKQGILGEDWHEWLSR